MFEQLTEFPQYLALNDQVYDVLKNAIIQHILPAGSKLDVNLLSKKWNISRSPVYDAIQRLMNEGLVSVVPRRGTFVASIAVKDVLQLWDVRLMFELRAAELIVENINEEQLNELKHILVTLDGLREDSKVDYIQYSKLDMELHTLPILWTQNQKLYQIYQAQNFQWYMTRLLKSSAGQAEHWEIFRAYEAGSLETVKRAITKHIEAGKSSVINLNNNGDC